jgi:hypothetical protein
VGDAAAGFDDAVSYQVDWVGAEQVEQADAAAEQHRHQVYLDFVEQSGGQSLLGCGGAVQTDGTVTRGGFRLCDRAFDAVGDEREHRRRGAVDHLLEYRVVGLCSGLSEPPVQDLTAFAQRMFSAVVWSGDVPVQRHRHARATFPMAAPLVVGGGHESGSCWPHDATAHRPPAQQDSPEGPSPMTADTAAPALAATARNVMDRIR